jgi:PilZ domain-containing protein
MSKHLPPYISRLWESVRKSKDRRMAPRYSPNEEVRVCVAWRNGEEYQYVAARIGNVSVSGALLLADGTPPADQPLWVRLDDPSSAEWVAAELIEARREARDRHVLRLAFRDGCPYAFFKASVNGFKADEGLMSLPQDLKHPEWW